MNDYTGGQTSPQTQPCYGCSGGSMQYTPGASQNASNPVFMGALPTGTPTGPTYGPTTYGPVSYSPPAAAPMAQPGMQLNFPQQQAAKAPGGMTANDLVPITALNQPMPMTTQSLQYINGFLRTQIGKKVTVDFLIGTNTLVDKTGTLLGVGANYILINEIETDDLLICDFYTIKFVKVYY
jgi:hypothetical protein